MAINLAGIATETKNVNEGRFTPYIFQVKPSQGVQSIGGTFFNVVCEIVSQVWSLKPTLGEAFKLDCQALDADDEIDIGQTVGDAGTLILIRTGASTYQWHLHTDRGTHFDVGAS